MYYLVLLSCNVNHQEHSFWKFRRVSLEWYVVLHDKQANHNRPRANDSAAAGGIIGSEPIRLEDHHADSRRRRELRLAHLFKLLLVIQNRTNGNSARVSKQSTMLCTLSYVKMSFFRLLHKLN